MPRGIAALEYLITLKNPKTGHTRMARINAASTGQALAKLGQIPQGYGIDSVRKNTDPKPASQEIDVPDYDEAPPPVPPPAHEAPPARRSEPNQYRGVFTGHSTGAVVLAWIVGALIGAGTFWVPDVMGNRESPRDAQQQADAYTPAQTTGLKNISQQEDASQPTDTAPINTTAASTITGTIWGLDEGESLPAAIYRVTGRDPQTRFLYEALVAADNEDQAKDRYQEWSPNHVIRVDRVAWLRGSPDGEQP